MRLRLDRCVWSGDVSWALNDVFVAVRLLATRGWLRRADAGDRLCRVRATCVH